MQYNVYRTMAFGATQRITVAVVGHAADSPTMTSMLSLRRLDVLRVLFTMPSGILPGMRLVH
jgi:hypothetical protein